MAATFRALVIDDDPDALAWMSYTLNERFPELEVTTRELPDLSGRFDLYFIDNDFNGKRMAAELASAIRASNPQAMIVAFSASLDHRTLKLLVNAGCDGACEKSEPEDVGQMLGIVSAYLNRRRSETQEKSTFGLMGAMHSIRNLLREWNRRLDINRVVDCDATPASGIMLPPGMLETIRARMAQEELAATNPQSPQ